MIAFLGMGLLGSNFVRALRRRNEAVRVWSRSSTKASALADTGALVCPTPALAVAHAQRIHLTLSDDAAVDSMLEGAASAQAPLAVLPAIAARMDLLIAQGFGNHDWTVMARDDRQASPSPAVKAPA